MDIVEDNSTGKIQLKKIQVVNDEIDKLYKRLKESIKQQENTQINDQIISQMKQIVLKSQELANTVKTEAPNFSVDESLIQSLETFNSPFEHIKNEYLKIASDPDIFRIQNTQKNAKIALQVLEDPN